MNIRVMPDTLVHEVSTAKVTTAGIPANSAEETEVIRLFDQYRDRLLRYVLSLSLPVPDGEEIIQEVFLALFQHLREGRSRRNLPGWIFTVAHNLALKQREFNQRSEDRLRYDGESFGGVSDYSPDPEAQVLHQERQSRFLRVVQTFPEQDQCCLRLRAEGLRYREIAGVLGISLGSVAASLARSLARLMCLEQRF